MAYYLAPYNVQFTQQSKSITREFLWLRGQGTQISNFEQVKFAASENGWYRGGSRSF
jgi:PKD repeat protein